MPYRLHLYFIVIVTGKAEGITGVTALAQTAKRAYRQEYTKLVESSLKRKGGATTRERNHERRRRLGGYQVKYSDSSSSYTEWVEQRHQGRKAQQRQRRNSRDGRDPNQHSAVIGHAWTECRAGGNSVAAWPATLKLRILSRLCHIRFNILILTLSPAGLLATVRDLTGWLRHLTTLWLDHSLPSFTVRLHSSHVLKHQGPEISNQQQHILSI